ncbi:DUF3348 domain-containing protein [Variovorax sp. KK3]|uniref:DUF3348 domain-containing protein n=1 Tax=Variovorax sp. KK3 TaxID=1855728 RepID=UPI002117E0F2|nr:DUF3348 domain-containing protein [Variovorax sp. KK3]
MLARLGDTEARPSGPGFADRLGEWLGWTDAISLSAALGGNAGAVPSTPAAAGARVDTDALATECNGLRQALANAISADSVFTTPIDDAATDFPSYRRGYHDRQQTMEMAIGPLRDRLRAVLAARSPESARLAALDGVMGQVLGVQEYNLLAGVPARLARHFERLRRAATPPNEEGGDATAPGPWLEPFRQDMRALLLAELDFRFQPIDGLLEALRTSPPTEPIRP